MLANSPPPPCPVDPLHLPASLAVASCALIVEAIFGYPQALFRAIRHPVVWIGALIAALDRKLPRTRAAGVAALALVLALAVAPAIAAQIALPALAGRGPGILLLALAASTLLAQRSLHAHVTAVADGLDRGGLDGGRAAVARIVGRNPASLDAAGVARAAIESLAENFSDGVVAPALWCAVFGLPGAVFYKATNTADSMIGHRTPCHADFGWAAARLDDAVNLPASRLAALLLALAAATMPGASAGGAFHAAIRDARRHRSPNAGWPEAAMAGALGLRLAGPRVYGATRVDDAWMGNGRAEATQADLRRALALYRRACAIQMILFILLTMALIAPG